jgi:hypothetical protein
MALIAVAGLAAGSCFWATSNLARAGPEWQVMQLKKQLLSFFN